MKNNQTKELTQHGGMKSFYKRALELGAKLRTFPGAPGIVKVEYRGKAKIIRAATTPVWRQQGVLTKDKNMTKVILEEFGVRTPRGFLASDYAETTRLIRKNKLKFPLIIKPVDGSRATGVTWDIRDESGLKKAIGIWKKAKQAHPHFLRSDQFLVEEMFVGKEFRVLVFDGKVLSAVEKTPAGVTGDGRATIRELVDRFNEKRKEGFKIRLDKVAEQMMRDQGLGLETVLKNGNFFKFRNNLNMSDGGRSIERTREMSDYFKSICVRAVEAVGLSFGGVDLIAKNISAQAGRYVVLEVNPNPYYNMHEKPLVEGKGIDVSGTLLRHLWRR